MKRRFFAMFLLLAGGVVGSEPLRIRVERILDGDTFHGKIVAGTAPAGAKMVRDSLVSIRLAGIDAPEKDQPRGDSSRHALERRISGRTVSVEIVDVDRYRRILGRVEAGDVDVNLAMVADGDAWMYRRFSGERAFDSLETAARAAHRGLWADPAPVPPWDWRRSHRGR